MAAMQTIHEPAITPESDFRDDEWKKAIRKIHEMLSVCDDWDGQGAKAPGPNIIFYAMQMAEAKRRTSSYPAPTRVVATPAGTIGLEWQQGSTYTEAEVIAPYKSEWMQIATGMPAKHWVEADPGERQDLYSALAVSVRKDWTNEDPRQLYYSGRLSPTVYPAATSARSA